MWSSLILTCQGMKHQFLNHTKPLQSSGLLAAKMNEAPEMLYFAPALKVAAPGLWATWKGLGSPNQAYPALTGHLSYTTSVAQLQKHGRATSYILKLGLALLLRWDFLLRAFAQDFLDFWVVKSFCGHQSHADLTYPGHGYRYAGKGKLEERRIWESEDLAPQRQPAETQEPAAHVLSPKAPAAGPSLGSPSAGFCTTVYSPAQFLAIKKEWGV